MAVAKWLLLVVCLVSSALGAKKRPSLKPYLKWEALGECPGTSYENKVVSAKRNFTGFGLDGSFIINQIDIPEKLNTNFVVKKCKTLEDNACEHFIGGTVDFCKVISDAGQFYSPAFQAIHPKLRCPLKKGVYQLRNATFDTEALFKMIKLVPPEYWDYHWLIQFRVYAPPKPKKILACISLVYCYSYIKSIRT